MRTASVLAAYFAVEQAQAFRRLLWPRLALIAAVAWFLEIVTLLPPAALVTTLFICGAIAVGSIVFEWRSHKKLQTLLHARTNSVID